MSEFLFLNLNSLPENDMASTIVSPAMPPLACEIIDLEDETTSFQDLLHYGSIQLLQFLTDSPVEQCFSNQVETSQIVNSQHREGERNAVVDSSEDRTVQQAEGANQGIDLNKTPPQKPKRKKHRPKVVREGKPARTPKPATPKTPENPSGKRKYVRKKKDVSPRETPTNPQDTLSSAGLGEVVDQDGRNGKKPVRRSLKFDLNASQEANGSERLSGSHDERSADACFLDIPKRMRTENYQKEPIPNASSVSTSPPSGWRTVRNMRDTTEVYGFTEAQRLMELQKIPGLKCMLDFNQVELGTYDGRTHDHRLPVQNEMYCMPPHTPEKAPGYRNSQETRSFGPQARVETLIAQQNEIYCMPPHTPEKGPRYINGQETISFGPQARVETLIAQQNEIYCMPPHTPEKAPGYRNGQETISFGPQARVETRIAQQTKAKPRGRRKKERDPHVQSGALVPYWDPVDEIVQKLRILCINSAQEGTAIHPQNALVPYVGGVGAMVSFEGQFNLAKKRKPRAKVDLDQESHRVWKLLMGKECSEGEDGTQIDKEKWWEEERRVFRGRADSFIARMHLIQGDRRFSLWKGSVVDSVVGVFLTQNVSDHLSSSAFMSLAARFPQSKGNTKVDMLETISRPIVANDASRRDGELSNSEFCGQSSLWVYESERRDNRETVYSNESLESNCGGGIIDYSKESSLEFHEIEIRTGQEPPDSALGTEVMVTSCTGALEGDDRKSLEDVVSSQNSVASSQHSSECPGQTTFQIQPCQLLNFEADELLNGSRINCSFTELLEMADGMALNDLTAGNRRILSAELSERHSYCQSEASLKKNVSSACLNQKHATAVMFQQREGDAVLQMERTQKAVEGQAEIHNFGTYRTCSNLHNNNERNGKVAKGAGEANVRNEVSAFEKASAETLNNASKGKKVKAESEKKSFDWDSLRKQLCQNDAKNDRSSGSMDSLDYEALRNADVSEIAHAIRERGMNNMLAERIKDFLNRVVRDHGSIDLEWLRDIPPDKAKDYLLSIRGLGLKSVECVRLLTLHHLAFPVDTNVGRICVRLGWVPLQPLPESLQLHLLEMYPMLETIQKYLWPRLCTLDQRTLYELHYQLITFGKVFCTKSKPNCNACPMRGECKHFASAFASARLALPGPEEKQLVRSDVPFSFERNRSMASIPVPLPQLEGSTLSNEEIVPRNCEPIIEEPATPEHEFIEASEIDIEDAFYNDPDEIPTINLNFEEFTQNLQNYMQENNLGLQEGDMSKALVAISPEAASIPMPRLKNVSRLRTEHLVYELPDTHPLLKELDERELDDPCPYLLAIWTPGEAAQSTEPPTASCNSQDTGKLCDNNTCFSCNSIRESQSQIVRGTLLIPCRTANRGSFPLNGTYFQVNEVFADHDSSRSPIDVPRDWIWNLPRRTVYFGTSTTSIFKGLTTEEIQHCFWRGFICVRGFDRTMRAPRPLFARLHLRASMVTRNRKAAGAAAKEEE